MYLGSIERKVIHCKQCTYVSRIKDVHFEAFDYVEDAIKEGYRYCKCCDPMKALIKEYEKEMDSFCQSNAVYYTECDGALVIVTPFSEWKAQLNTDGKITLYHKNTKGDKQDYHIQGKFSAEPLNILNYIAAHDGFRLNNPLPKEKKEKAPPRKGTRRYRAAMRRAEAEKRRNDIRNVLNLIDSLQTQ